MDNRKIYYTERLHKIEKSERHIRFQLRWMAWLRLATFIAIFPGIFLIMPSHTFTGILFSLFFLILFLWLIKKYQQLLEKHNHLKALADLSRDEIKAVRHDYSRFAPGDEFIDTNHAYSFDMDLFGKGSLYQYLNRTVTHQGSKNLAGLLQKEVLNTDTILQRQAAIKELSGMNDLLQDFRAAGMLHKDNETDFDALRQWINLPLYYLPKRAYLIMAGLLPIVTFISVGLAFLLPFFRGVAIMLYFSQLLIVSSRLKHTSKEHSLISQRLALLKKYGHLLAVIERGNYSGGQLAEISNTLLAGDTSASASIKSLSKLVSAFDNRLNFLAAIFLEGLLLWDIRCMIRLEKWKTTQGKQLTKWINAIATFDAYTSLATYAFNHPVFLFPTLSEKVKIDAQGLGHVLLNADERVSNNFLVRNEGDFVIITGANMAGKSTFLRTVVTNMVLAMAGAPVCAKSFCFRPMSIFSSMRTSDSLNKHESYFYAELKRLKELLDRMRNGEKLFIVLDEILKGTNSTDKQKGSRSAMEQILKLGGTGIIATHDLELASIEKEFPGRVKNLCFEIEIDQANISFDYKLKEGITTKMNALLLMQQMGIIPG